MVRKIYQNKKRSVTLRTIEDTGTVNRFSIIEDIIFGKSIEYLEISW